VLGNPPIAAKERETARHGSLSGGEKTGRFWHVRSPPKIVCLHVNNTHFTHFSPRKIPLIRTRRSRARYFTPPPELTSYTGQIKTPQRCAILFAKVLAQELNVPILQELLHKITKVPPRNQSRILAEKQVRTLYNTVDKGPDLRGRQRALKRSDTAAIADYLKDPNTTIDDEGAPWIDIAGEVGVELSKIVHFKPPGKRLVSAQLI
jgi:hypothetical protein